MRRTVLIFSIVFCVFKGNAQKIVLIDSTATILNEWIKVISSENYFHDLNIRGISKDLNTSNLKLINQSLDDYKKGKYQIAIDDIKKIEKVNNFPEVLRIKLFIFTMSKIKLHQHFKARKWYYVSKNKMTSASFIRLQKNVENQKLSYNIDNYKKIRGARITALAIGGGIVFLAGTVSGE
jgi:hypothetical protein